MSWTRFLPALVIGVAAGIVANSTTVTYLVTAGVGIVMLAPWRIPRPPSPEAQRDARRVLLRRAPWMLARHAAPLVAIVGLALLVQARYAAGAACLAAAAVVFAILRLADRPGRP
jgi:hypothetical protein